MDKCEVHMTELVEGPIPVRYGLIRWSEAFLRCDPPSRMGEVVDSDS